MHVLNVTTVLVLLMSWPVSSEPISCEGSSVTVTAPKAEEALLTCDAVARAEALFEACNIPAITRPVDGELIDNLGVNCCGQYYRGKDRIEMLAPATMEARRMTDSFYAHLSTDAFFQSIVVHELTHAAIEDLPCPFDSCLVAHEYVAHVMQIMSLTQREQLRFSEGTGLHRKVSRDELNPVIYFMAPDLFARKAWAHFTQRDDPCGFVGQIVDGTVLLDYERFE